MGRGFAIAGPTGAAILGVLIMYSTFQPELVKERAKREESSSFTTQHVVTPEQHAEHVKEAAEADRDTVISRAMVSDFREAGAELRKEGGFAWGIRKKIFGTSTTAKDSEQGKPEERDGK